MHGLLQAAQHIRKAKEIVIAGHINPDGDSIGSLLALGLGIEKLGKRVHLVSQDGVPARYALLPGAGRVVKRFDQRCDLAISVDCSNKEILGKTFGIFKKAKEILEIDHHDFRRPFGQLRFIDHHAAAVGELVYAFLKELNISITKEIAQNLLTSIVVETNSFRLPSVRALTFEICADLVRRGVDFHKLSEMVYWSRTPESVLLSGVCLSRCVFLRNKRLVWSIVRRKDFRRAGGKDEDVDAVADQMRSIRGVQIVILFREKKKGVLRVSLRSKGPINVASVAEVFGGGGHFDVAGCSLPDRPQSIRKFLRLTSRLLK